MKVIKISFEMTIRIEDETVPEKPDIIVEDDVEPSSTEESSTYSTSTSSANPLDIDIKPKRKTKRLKRFEPEPDFIDSDEDVKLKELPEKLKRKIKNKAGMDRHQLPVVLQHMSKDKIVKVPKKSHTTLNNGLSLLKSLKNQDLTVKF